MVCLVPAALDARVDLGESACVVTRYCGSTATASVMQKLLTSVVQQLVTVFGTCLQFVFETVQGETFRERFHGRCSTLPPRWGLPTGGAME